MFAFDELFEALYCLFGIEIGHACVAGVFEFDEVGVGEVFFHILNVAFAGVGFFFTVPILNWVFILCCLFGHGVIVAGFKCSPYRFITDCLEDFGDVYQVFLGVVIGGKGFL